MLERGQMLEGGQMTVHDGPLAVPIVDIRPYVTGGSAADRRRVAQQIDRACCDIGFVQVSGHGVEARVIDGLTKAMDRFFDLPTDQKRRYRVQGANRGYSPPRSEALSLSLGVEPYGGKRDFFEAFNVGIEARAFPDLDLPEGDYSPNVWPAVDGFEAAVTGYVHEASRVASTLTEIFGDALGLPARFFEHLTDHSLDVLRMNNYALADGTRVVEEDLVGMGPHTDYGLVTVLWADQVPGLQVLGPDDRWHDVVPAEGALMVNLGDLTARLTNDHWRSTLHQVVPSVIDGTVVRRRSAAFFRDGNVDAEIATLPSCVEPGSLPRYSGSITVGEHIAAKLRGSRGGVVNRQAGSEAERVRAAR